MWRWTFIVALGLQLLWSGCGANMAPLREVNRVRIPARAGAPEDPAWVHDVLVRALALKTWQVVRDEPGEIIARVQVGRHSATIRITYDGRRYSIHHRASSEGLAYDGYAIHRRYNHWIKRLQVAIDRIASERPRVLDRPGDPVPPSSDIRSTSAPVIPTEVPPLPPPPTEDAQTAPIPTTVPVPAEEAPLPASEQSGPPEGDDSARDQDRD